MGTNNNYNTECKSEKESKKDMFVKGFMTAAGATVGIAVASFLCSIPCAIIKSCTNGDIDIQAEDITDTK